MTDSFGDIVDFMTYSNGLSSVISGHSLIISYKSFDIALLSSK